MLDKSIRTVEVTPHNFAETLIEAKADLKNLVELHGKLLDLSLQEVFAAIGKLARDNLWLKTVALTTWLLLSITALLIIDLKTDLSIVSAAAIVAGFNAILLGVLIRAVQVQQKKVMSQFSELLAEFRKDLNLL